MKEQLYQSLCMAIAEDTSVFDLAEAVARLVIEEYGEHNHKHFIDTILQLIKQ